MSRELWRFLGPSIDEPIYDRRAQMAGGEERNGLELWRKLHDTNEGGAEHCAIAGIGRLHRFEQCPSLEHVANQDVHPRDLAARLRARGVHAWPSPR